MRGITQKDIAKRLSVSQPLVASVLSANPRVQVSPATRQRILDAAAEMGYVPNATGRMLREGKTNTVSVGYLSPEAIGDHGHFAGAIETLAHELGQVGYKIEVRVFPDNDELMDWLRYVAASRSSDAIVLWEPNDDRVEAQGKVLEGLEFPFICRGHHELTHPDWIQAEYDHTGMIRQVVEKLAGMGHEKIAYLGFDADQPYARHSLQAFHRSVSDLLHCETPEEWMLISTETYQSGMQIMKQVRGWMQMPAESRPTAIAVGGDGTALRLVELTLFENGVQFGDGPGKISLAGTIVGEHLICKAGSSLRYQLGNDLTRAMVREQLIPLLTEGRPRERHVRYMPPLVPSGEPAIQWHDSLLARWSVPGA